MIDVRTRRFGGAAGAAALALVVVAVAGCTGAVSAGAGSRSAVPAGGISSAPASTVPPEPGTGIPAGLLLPGEGQRSTTVEFTDWTTDNTATQSWLLDPCRPTSYPTDRLRTAFRTVSQSGPETFSARQLGVYPSSEVATEVLAGFRRTIAACRTGGQETDGTRWTWVSEDVPGLGDDGFVAATTLGGSDYSSTGARIAVTRVGPMVFLVFNGGEYYTAELDDGARLARQVAEQFVDSL